VNLINLLNPAQEAKVEVALYKMAQGNATSEILAATLVPLAIAIGFGQSLNTVNLFIWLSIMACAALSAAITYWVLNPHSNEEEPSSARLRSWRWANFFSIVITGIGWGSIGMLFSSQQDSSLNAALLMCFMAVLSAGGNASAAHSYRLYFIVVACAVIGIFVNLSSGFGEQALPLGALMILYTLFVARVSFSAQASIMHTVELQIQNEVLLKERAVAMQLAERERIYRDLHDDVGAKLLGLAISAQRANLPREADLARSALQDLRDVVSRSSQLATRFDHLLADWRSETERRVQAAGLDLAWHVPTSEDASPVNPSASLHLSRILREAISNVLRHACASHIHVSLQRNGDRWILQIQDDGVGLPDTDFRANRGMIGMQERASLLGGKVTWESLSPRGCKVVVEFAIPHLTLDQAALT
jgi:signal transduction histidine kinase